MNKFEPTVCPDCSFPPNFVVTEKPSKSHGNFFQIKCRDCGDCWEEFVEQEGSDCE